MTWEQRVRANFRGGTILDNPLSDSASTITSTEFEPLPAVASGQHLAITLDPLGVDGDPEVIWVRGHVANDDEITSVLRGQEGTTARAHNLGTAWEHAPTTKDYSPLWVPGDPYGLDDEFDDRSVHADWVRVDRSGNSALLTWTEADLPAERNGAMSLLHLSGLADANSEFHALMRPLGGASFPLTVECAVRSTGPYATANLMNGLVFANGVTYGSGAQITTHGYSNASNGSGLFVSAYRLTGYSTFVNETQSGQRQFVGARAHYRLKWDAANTFSSWWSGDGISWIPVMSGHAYTLTPTHVGLLHSHYSANMASVSTWDYFRAF